MADLNQCEACSGEPPLKLFMGMWMCSDCYNKNKQLSEESNAQAENRVKAERDRAADVVNINSILKKAGDIDARIEVKTDLFNAETVSIVALSDAIKEDDSITNKASHLAEMLLKRYQGYKEKIFANSAENVELANKQNAIQKFLNELKNKLTEQEREKYKLLDATYQPNKIKLSNKTINSPAKPKKYDAIDYVRAAERASVPVSVIKMLCVAKNMSPMQASDSLLNAGSRPPDSSKE